MYLQRCNQATNNDEVLLNKAEQESFVLTLIVLFVTSPQGTYPTRVLFVSWWMQWRVGSLPILCTNENSPQLCTGESPGDTVGMENYYINLHNDINPLNYIILSKVFFIWTSSYNSALLFYVRTYTQIGCIDLGLCNPVVRVHYIKLVTVSKALVLMLTN
jgi:hypothetical protein